MNDDDRQGLLDFLSQPGSYAEPTTTVERVDTHISQVFLTDRHAYKLKKPVAFEFLDFRTREARRLACLEELRINRRLAPDVYLGAVAVTLDRRRRFRWAGPQDEPVDWLVKMRRLPESQRLDRLLVDGRLAPADLDELATTLLRFYQSLPPLPVSADTYLAQLERHVAGNRRDLETIMSGESSRAVVATHSGQRRLLRLWPERWRTRVCDGRIVEGHGDLRPEHVYLTPRPIVIDGIEFNAEFRQLDVLDELCFLWVECERLGAGDVGRTIVERYERETQDRPPEGVVEFYRSYRACVRAKVAALRAVQQAGGEREESLASARAYLTLAREALGRHAAPLLVVVRGLSGVGKSLVAGRLAETLDADWLQTDALRASTSELQATPPQEAPADDARFATGRYAPTARRAVYARLLERADEALSAGRSVVLDGAFLAADLRAQAARRAVERSAAFLELTCRCSAELAAERVSERLAAGADRSEMRPEWLALQAREEEPCEPTWPARSIDTSGDSADVVRSALDAVRDRCGESSRGL